MVKIVTLFTSIFFLINCSSQQKNDPSKGSDHSNYFKKDSYKVAMDSARIRIAKQRGESIDSLYLKTKHTLSNEDVADTVTFDTLIIKKATYYLGHSQLNNPFILNSKHDTIYKHSNWAYGVEVVDFNDDGYEDLLFLYITNTPNTYDLALFDDKANSFINIEDFFLYPDPKKIEGTKYYYSYHKSGCADFNWDSDLFYFENFKPIRLGNISGIGCKREVKNGIFIYKVLTENDSLVLIESLHREPGYYNDKWEFIEKYWNENYTGFL